MVLFLQMVVQGENINHLLLVISLNKTIFVFPLTLNFQDLIGDSPYCLSYSFCDVSLENLVMDPLTIPSLIFFFILITCLVDIVLIL